MPYMSLVSAGVCIHQKSRSENADTQHPFQEAFWCLYTTICCVYNGLICLQDSAKRRHMLEDYCKKRRMCHGRLALDLCQLTTCDALIFFYIFNLHYSASIGSRCPQHHMCIL
uniref:Uncharacterized protein n=1 Tax=Eutreptiella gymnastica TaxID=73025 RepID=A0A7S4CTX2_9EUGL|mmetsp:Transcript_41245/g.69393  ORF Transcript_41245/g.69393 Transcript_41245/m.69393 type:complete len:113 (-) Transcript_41245:111-449(-)